MQEKDQVEKSEAHDASPAGEVESNTGGSNSAIDVKEGSQSHIIDEDEDGKQKLSPRSQIMLYVDQFQYMIEFMDFSFETQFQTKDKEFMIAYREHVQVIQKDLNELKENCNDQRYQAMRQKKIDSLEKKLSQIRKQALFLGDMSEMHKKESKRKKIEVDEEEREKVFLQEQIIKQRNESKKMKQQLHQATLEYDVLYSQAQDFLNNCEDKDKVIELLEILEQTDEQKQAQIQAIEFKQKREEKQKDTKPNQIEQQAHLGPGIVQSMKKY